MGGRSCRRTGPQEGGGSGGKLTEAVRWWLENGEAWRTARDQAEAAGGEIPEALQLPEIMDGYDGWYEDFWRLSTERQIFSAGMAGVGAGPIPASAIDRHVTGWGCEDAELFEHCIRQMDEAYLMRQNKTDQPQPTGSPRDAFRSATSGRRGR